MTKHYTHLTQEERYQIHAYKKAGFSPSMIALDLNLHVSTIKRELVRNACVHALYSELQAICSKLALSQQRKFSR